MRPYRPRIVPLLFTLVNVWLWMYLLVEVAPQTCQKTVFQCTYSTLNLSSDGLQDLRASVELSPGMYSIEVDRLITKYTDGVLLQILSEFADTVEYQRYHERVLRIPPNVDLKAITVKQAPQLQVITVVAPNTKLTLLELHNTGLSTLPASLLNLRGLYILKISECNLEYFSLDPLANSPNISIVTIDDNNINKLVTSNNSQLFIPITTLSLSNNQLQFVDEDFFKPLRNLEFLVLTRNKIKRFGGRPFILSNLMVFNLIQNQLLSLNVTQWKMPALVEFCLDYNNLTRVPAGLVGFPKLEILRLRGNRLTSIDLRLLEGFKAVWKIDLHENMLENVLISRPGKVSFPTVKVFQLGFNRLSRLDVARWDFPLLQSISLQSNQLQRLPNLFQSFPKLLLVDVLQNPLLCSTVQQLERYVDEYKLRIETSAKGFSCTSNSTYTTPAGWPICCVQ